MKKRWFKKLIGGLSMTSAMFVFQACYGTNQDFGLDLYIEGQVLSEDTGEPIEGIKVSLSDSIQYEITDENGSFALYTERLDSVTMTFSDIDSTQNGEYITKDTVLTDLDDSVYLNVALKTVSSQQGAVNKEQGTVNNEQSTGNSQQGIMSSDKQHSSFKH